MSQEYENMNCDEQNKMLYMRKMRDMHYKILNINDENIKECECRIVYSGCLGEEKSLKHGVKITDTNDNVYVGNLLSTEIYNAKHIYNRLTPDVKMYIDKEMNIN